MTDDFAPRLKHLTAPTVPTFDTASEAAANGEITVRALAVELTTSATDIDAAVEYLVLDVDVLDTEDAAYVAWDDATVQVPVRSRYFPTRVLTAAAAQGIRDHAGNVQGFRRGVAWNER